MIFATFLISEIQFTRVTSQSWSVVVSTVIEVQRVPVMLGGKTHNLDLERRIKDKHLLMLTLLAQSEKQYLLFTSRKYK